MDTAAGIKEYLGKELRAISFERGQQMKGNG
jgi:hypothetical protein